MKQGRWTLMFMLAAGCVGTAEAQPGAGRRADAGAARDPRYVVERASGEWQARCVASVGCPRPAEIPRCGQGSAPTGLDDVWGQRFDRRGQRVRVRGNLRAFKACTELACNPRTACCNHCTGTVSFEGAVSNGLAQTNRLTLDLPASQAFNCLGDDSGVCCTTQVPAGAVIAEGTLQPVEGSGGAWRVAGAQICVE